MPDRRVIAHLDCDAFYVSVELLRRPELVGKPVVVAGSGPRAVVTTASYEARKFGVGSASPAAQARRLCPQAVFLPPDFPAYRDEVARGLGRSCARGCRSSQQVGLDEGYADVTEREKPLRVLRELVAEVRDRTGITISVGVGPNRLIAKVSSDLEKPQGFVAMGREEACRRLAERARRGSSPASGRRPPSGSPRWASRRSARCSGPTRRSSRARFGGRHGARPASPARTSTAPTSSRPRRGPAKSRSNETTFDRDIADLGRARGGARRGSAGELAEGLRRKQARGRTIAIKVRLDDWTTVTRARTLPARRRTTRRRSRAWRSSCCAPTRRRARCGCSACGWRRSTDEASAGEARREPRSPLAAARSPL